MVSQFSIDAKCRAPPIAQRAILRRGIRRGSLSEVALQFDPMQRHQFLARFLAGVALASGVVVLPASAADFYHGKTLTVIVGYAPGGGVDATARAITRHLARFIPGQPNIVVQNMEGAAGLISANYLHQRAVPDGLTVAIPGRSWYIESII